MLEKTEGVVNNGQPKYTSNTGHNRRRMGKNLQKAKQMSNMDPTKNNRWGEWGLSESRYSQIISNF